MNSWELIAAVGAFIWLIIVLLPWRPWSTREALDAPSSVAESDLSDLTAVIPARNEAAGIEKALVGLHVQGHGLSIVLVDDRSTDATAAIAQAMGGENLRVINGQPLPEGWTGKLWALDQGYRHVNTPLTLLIDADIQLQPGILPGMLEKLRKDSLNFISLMAQLRMVSFWEKLLTPAFIYFFKMLYPFHLSNSKFKGIAAAAGGCILLETRLIKNIGGFTAIRDQLIDDCALAKRIKAGGSRTWIGLTRSVHSMRRYDHPGGIWKMVARTAFFQLRYSVVLLAGTTGAMLLVFCLPVAGLFFPAATPKIISAGALAAMMLTYWPTLRFYGRSRAWSLCLPFIAMLYLCMTWSSAVRHWRGAGSEWKDRVYGMRSS